MILVAMRHPVEKAMKPLVSIVQQTGRQVVVFVRVLERRVLARVDETLRALDGRVQMRLRKLERRRRPGRRPRTTRRSRRAEAPAAQG
jgi:hypothetical protein